MKVGFIGLGIMGKPMALNVQKAGHTVVAYDHHQDRIDAIVAAGGVGAKSGCEVGEQSDVVIMMMQNSPNVESALFDEDGVFEGLSEGKAVIDMSSINPIKSREFAARLAKKGVDRKSVV